MAATFIGYAAMAACPAAAATGADDLRPMAGELRRDLDDALTKMTDAIRARQLLVADSVRYLDRMAADACDDRALQLDLAVAYAKLGTVQGDPYGANLGDTSGALASYCKSLELAGRALAGDPGNAKARRLLLVAGTGAGDVLAALGRRDESLARYRAALEVARPLADAGASNARAQRDLWLVLERIGDEQFADRHYADAVASYRDGLAAAERTAALEPECFRSQQDLAASHTALGSALLATHQDEAASAAYRRGIEVSERLAAANPAARGAQAQARGLETEFADGSSTLSGRALAIAARLARAGIETDELQRELALARQSAVARPVSDTRAVRAPRRFVRQPVPGEHGG